MKKRLRGKVQIHKVEEDWWVDGMNKYDGYVGNAILANITMGSEPTYIVEGAVGKNGKFYLFGESCLKEV